MEKQHKAALVKSEQSREDVDFIRSATSNRYENEVVGLSSYAHEAIMQTRTIRGATTAKVVEVLGFAAMASSGKSKRMAAEKADECCFTSNMSSLNFPSPEAPARKISTIEAAKVDVTEALKVLLQPGEKEQSVFLETRYCHQLTTRQVQVAQSMVRNVGYYRQLKKMKWAVRMFVNEVEVSNANNEMEKGIASVWDEDRFVKSKEKYKSGKNVMKARDIEAEVINSLNRDFNPKKSVPSPKPTGLIKEVSFKRVSSSKAPKKCPFLPFSTSALWLEEQKVRIELSMNEGVTPKSVVLETAFCPEKDLIRESHGANIIVEVKSRKISETKKIRINYGFECLSKEEAFAEKIPKWNEIFASTERQMKHIREYPAILRESYQARLKMSTFLNELRSKNVRAGLGAIGVDLLKGIELDNMDFRKNYDEGLKRLRFIKMEMHNRDKIRQIFGILSQTKPLSERVADVHKAGFGNPYNFSEQAGEDDSIDFFISHTWTDDPEVKFAKLVEFSDDFAAKNGGRLPKLWIDMFCIDQDNDSVEICVKLLPLFLLACKQMVVMISENLTKSLWCLSEIFTRHLLGDSRQKPSEDIMLLPIEDCKDLRVDVANARCYQKEDEIGLRRILEHIPGLHKKLVEEMITEVIESRP